MELAIWAWILIAPAVTIFVLSAMQG